MSEMTSLEWCMAVLQGGVSDRVPVCPENFMHPTTVAGYTIRE